MGFSTCLRIFTCLTIATLSSGIAVQPREVSNSTLLGTLNNNQINVRCSTGPTRVHNLYSYEYCRDPATAIAFRRSRSGDRWIGDEVIDLASLRSEPHWQSARGECSFTWTLDHDQEYIGPPLPIKRGDLGAAAIQMIAQCRRGWQYGIREGEVQVTPRVSGTGKIKSHTASILRLHLAQDRAFHGFLGVNNVTTAEAATS